MTEPKPVYRTAVFCPGCGGCVESGAYEMKTIEWTGLYKKGWGDELVPEAYSHPAKVAFGLAEKIYSFMLDEGMIKQGDVVGDPFGGVAGFAFYAMRNGLHWRGVELEPRFVELGNQNIGLWMGRYSPHFDGWGTAVLVQGDSRNFAGIVGGLSGCVSSPPYADTIESGDGPGARWDAKTHPGNPDKGELRPFAWAGWAAGWVCIKSTIWRSAKRWRDCSEWTPHRTEKGRGKKIWASRLFAR